MALIRCPECGREISSSTEKCIHCGCPISGGQQDSKIHVEEAERYETKGKKSNGKKTAAIVIPIVVIVLAVIGKTVEHRLQQESAGEQVVSGLAQEQETSGSVQEQVPSGAETDGQGEEESTGVQEDKDAGTGTPDFTDAQILWDRFLVASEDGRDAYGTVYYGKDSDTVKEILAEFFVSKDAVSGDIDPEDYKLSDFDPSAGDNPLPVTPSYENVQDIGNYYLLTIGYAGLDDVDAAREVVDAGMFDLKDSTVEYDVSKGKLIDASSLMNNWEFIYEKGYFEDKEYASFFGSGREDAQ